MKRHMHESKDNINSMLKRFLVHSRVIENETSKVVRGIIRKKVQDLHKYDILTKQFKDRNASKGILINVYSRQSGKKRQH